jgi:Glycosyl hydrolases family 2, sugar binding domain/Glycosyl hydrolases family 2/Glycosyl hydrolases family 2, TIM barrel domain
MPSVLPFHPSESQQRLELEQGWEFLADPTAKLKYADLKDTSGWRAARVGLSWNVQFEDLREYSGAAWYRTWFEPPQSRGMRHVLLKFGAVDYYCEVYVNGMKVGSHEGGYTPFSFDLSDFVNDGDNELAIKVIDPPMDEKQNLELFPEMLYNEIPHGKQNWYIQNSGIWQGVRLEFTPAIYVDRTDITPHTDGEFRIDVKLAGKGLQESRERIESTRIRVTIHDNTGRMVWECACPLIESDTMVLRGRIQQPKLWGPNSPALYTLDATLEGAVSYRRRTRFGFRELSARDGELLLNNKPFFMIAALDQDFYPETIHTPASEEFVRDMMLKAKKLGINVLRCHLKVAHPVYLDIADELGMLVWAELPSWSDCWFPADHFSERAAQRAEQMFGEIMLRDWNHPCLVIQTVINESWGINLKEASQREWLKQTFDKTKAILAPLGRLVIDNSACEGNFHVESDIEDFHNYYSQPDQSDLWDTFVLDFASRPEWTYSPYGDAVRTRKEPLVISEFGNWGLPKLPEELPWWFNSSFGEREVTRPSGVFERFRKFKLDRMFRDYNDIAEESQWHQFISLKYEIESMRRLPPLKGYCVTGMTDVHWEVNGLLDMWRNDKVFSDELTKLQEPDLVMAGFESVNFYESQQVEVPIVLSHYSERDLTGARVVWSLDTGETGAFSIAEPIVQGAVVEVGVIRFKAPSVTVPIRVVLSVEVRAKLGNRVMENGYVFYVYPQRSESENVGIAFHDPLGTANGLADALSNAGYAVQQLERADPNALIVATSLDDNIATKIAAGRVAVIIADSEHAIGFSAAPYKATKRAATWLDGRWFSNYNWIDIHSDPYREIGFHRLLAFESRHAVPQFVIENVPAEDFDSVIAGITLGWLNLNNALTLQTGIRSGRALITTFRFEKYGSDPYSKFLLNAYISHAIRGEWKSSVTLEHEETASVTRT